MTEALLLLAPALCATAIADHLRKTPLARRGAVYLVAANAVLVNAAVWAMKTAVFHTGEAPLFPMTGTTASAALRYLAVAVPVSVFAGFAEAVLAKRFGLETVVVRKKD